MKIEGNIFSRKDETLEFFANINKKQLDIRVAKFIYKALKGIEEFDKPLSKVTLDDLNGTDFPFTVSTYYEKVGVSDFIYRTKELDLLMLEVERIESSHPLIVFRTRSRKLLCMHTQVNYTDKDHWILSKYIDEESSKRNILWYVQPFEDLVAIIKGTM